jgi:GAF domain-containing protein
MTTMAEPIDDFTSAALPSVEPVDLRERIVSAGYRSLLVAQTRARDQKIGLGFWSKRPHAFGTEDLPVACRIADHVALAVSHEQLADAARQASSIVPPRERADRSSR